MQAYDRARRQGFIGLVLTLSALIVGPITADYYYPWIWLSGILAFGVGIILMLCAGNFYLHTLSGE